MNKIEEIWKPVVDCEGLYEVSNQGRLRSAEHYSMQNHLIPCKILSISHGAWGYTDVSLYKNGERTHKKMHRLVAEAFIPNPDNLPEVDHIDMDKDNNCVDNLRWCTHSQNHSYPQFVELKRKLMTGRKLPEEQRLKMCKPINVLKNNEIVYTFESYADLDKNSKQVIGEQLWGVYVRKVINGEMESYHGYTFQLA